MVIHFDKRIFQIRWKNTQVFIVRNNDKGRDFLKSWCFFFHPFFCWASIQSYRQLLRASICQESTQRMDCSERCWNPQTPGGEKCKKKSRWFRVYRGLNSLKGSPINQPVWWTVGGFFSWFRWVSDFFRGALSFVEKRYARMRFK